MNRFVGRTIRESIELSWASEVTCSAAAPIEDVERRSESKSDGYLAGGNSNVSNISSRDFVILKRFSNSD